MAEPRRTGRRMKEHGVLNRHRMGRTAALAVSMAIAVAGLAAPAQAQFSAGFSFLEAVKKKDGNKVEAAISEPGSTIINTRDVSTGETALHIVTGRRDLTWMSYLLQHGANANVRDVRGVTPLQLATNLGFTDGVELLVQYKADPSEANDAGETPLISAVHRHDLAMVRALLDGGADPERPDNSGRTARDYARIETQDQILAAFDTRAKNQSSKPAAGAVYGPKL